MSRSCGHVEKTSISFGASRYNDRPATRSRTTRIAILRFTIRGYAASPEKHHPVEMMQRGRRLAIVARHAQLVDRTRRFHRRSLGDRGGGARRAGLDPRRLHGLELPRRARDGRCDLDPERAAVAVRAVADVPDRVLHDRVRDALAERALRVALRPDP